MCFIKTNNVEEENNVERHIVFPFPWHWGHIYQIGNNVISNWKKESPIHGLFFVITSLLMLG